MYGNTEEHAACHSLENVQRRWKLNIIPWHLYVEFDRDEDDGNWKLMNGGFVGSAIMTTVVWVVRLGSCLASKTRGKV